jgi:8-oxo-dGTP pyrophosphatase MutT (NUDIX family)
MKTRVRSVIVVNGLILLIHRVKEGLEYWVFPGGGVEESDQSFEHALQRECLEEIGVEVRIVDLFADETKEGTRELFYRCEILSGEVGTGKGLEFQAGNNYKGTYDFQWIPVAELEKYNMKPKTIKTKVLKEVI